MKQYDQGAGESLRGRLWHGSIKRVLDITVSVGSLVITAPVIAVVAIAILLEDGPPILFVQERVGRGGRRFPLFKFRSMVHNAQEKGMGLAVAANDDRITKVGKVIRALSIDELPQFINIIRGDMSVVGPRPTVPSQVANYNDHQRRRLEVRPGLTGWAQINGRNSIPWEKRIALDVWYVDNRSLALDLLIMLRTPLVMIPRANTHYGAGGVVEDFKGSES